MAFEPKMERKDLKRFIKLTFSVCIRAVFPILFMQLYFLDLENGGMGFVWLFLALIVGFYCIYRLFAIQALKQVIFKVIQGQSDMVLIFSKEEGLKRLRRIVISTLITMGCFIFIIYNSVHANNQVFGWTFGVLLLLTAFFLSISHVYSRYMIEKGREYLEQIQKQGVG
ncbi:hypothetical protein [Ammoniphilus resinae]|uniref:Na+-transporting methylmalonyl-CoA/oxaloacetate decarboxylase gamma subunit n=1 Tax=Ammoniphilus resinae TaxID=861532 RepID=A0ABS4GUY4_9BACL|nr:hypothetical protein [Ammoniphilus resinae]MBP1934067.1 Na+-transporting methylmalonyl-CoA/oxaloacetate decarboxylase gamma subunit [Ammoniphilus resinae]